jgi:hypothetical protein
VERGSYDLLFAIYLLQAQYWVTVPHPVMKMLMTICFRVADPANPVNTVLIELNFWGSVKVVFLE